MAPTTLGASRRSAVRDQDDKAAELCYRSEALTAIRAPYEGDWQDIVRLIAPGCEAILGETEPGLSRMEAIYDSHPIRQPKILSANIMSGVTNQFVDWQKLKFRHAELASQQVAGWLEDTDRRILTAYAGSNFYQMAGQYYYQWVCFGTAAMWAGSRLGPDASYLHFQTLPTGSYCIADNADGLVDTLFREIWWTPRQALQRFGNECSRQIWEKADNKATRDTPLRFLHCVYPRTDRAPERWDNQHMPFAGVYLEWDTKHICDETGYQEFPFLVTRGERVGKSPYGFGPGHVALPDVRVLNLLRQLHLEQLTLWVRPPLKVLQEGVLGSISLESYAVNVLRQMDALQPLDLTGRPDLVQLDQADLRRSIEDCFYVNALQALPPPEASNMTAYEVSQRVGLMTRLMGPLFYSLLSEFLIPLADRVFGLLWRAGALAPPPLEVLQAAAVNQGQLDVEYNGPLVWAQHGEDVRALHDLIGLTSQVATATQSLAVFDNFDLDKQVRGAAAALGVPQSYVRDLRDVLQLRAARQQQQEQMQAAQQRNENMQAMGRIAPLVQAIQQQPAALAA